MSNMSVKLKHISILPPLMLWNVWAPNCYINRIRRNSLTVIKLTILAQGSDTSIGMKLSWNIDSHFQLSTVLVFLPNHAYYVADVGQEVMGWLQQQVLIAIHSAGRTGKIILLAELIRKTFALFLRKTGLNLSSYNRHMTKTKIIMISNTVGIKNSTSISIKKCTGGFYHMVMIGYFP